MAKDVKDMNLKELCEAIGIKTTNEKIKMLETYINLKNIIRK